MRKHLRVIVGAPELLKPLRRAAVLVGSFGSWDLPVGDVPDEQMPEGVFGVTGQRRGPLAPHELPPLKRVEPLLEHAALAVCEQHESAKPEGLADNGGVLDQLFLLEFEQIEAGGDHALHRLGQLLDPPALPQGPRVLLGVERVTAGAGEQLRLGVGRQDGALEQLAEQPRGFLVRER